MRLTRVGAKKRPAYRIVVADSRAPRDGRHVDIVGQYDPMTNPATVNIDTERAVKWLQNGAQPSERVRILLRHSGVLKAHEEARLAARRALKAQEAQREGGAPNPLAGAAEAAQHLVGQVAETVGHVAGAAAEVVADAAGAAVAAVAPGATERR